MHNLSQSPHPGQNLNIKNKCHFHNYQHQKHVWTSRVYKSFQLTKYKHNHNTFIQVSKVSYTIQQHVINFSKQSNHQCIMIKPWKNSQVTQWRLSSIILQNHTILNPTHNFTRKPQVATPLQVPRLVMSPHHLTNQTHTHTNKQ